MRAVKSVLVMAGALKRGNVEMSEDIVLIRAIREANLPKFLSDDLPLFHAIVGDLFTGCIVPESDYYGSFQTQMLKRNVQNGLAARAWVHHKDQPALRTFQCSLWWFKSGQPVRERHPSTGYYKQR